MAKKFYNQLLVDCNTNSSKKLEDRDLLNRVLTEIPEMIGMKILKKIEVIECKTEKPSKDGLSATTIIGDTELIGGCQLRESHINLHTFTQRKLLCFDLFSCIPFDCEKVEDYLRKVFKPRTMKIQRIMREGIIF